MQRRSTRCRSDTRRRCITTALAERLGVTPASASGMVKRLGELGLVDHQPYRGVR